MRIAPSFLSLLLVTSLGCGKAEPSADQPAPIAAAPVEKAPVEKAAPAPAEKAAAPAPDQLLAVVTPVEEKPGALGLDEDATLLGYVGFDARRARGPRCRKVDAKLARTLARGRCERHTEGSFAEGAGEWTSCVVGKAEWMIYATQAICEDQLGTMEANAP